MCSSDLHAGVSMRGRCATDAVLNTFAISVAQNALPHSVPPANLKHTPSKQAFQTSLLKPVTPIKVDRLNFLLSGYVHKMKGLYHPTKAFLIQKLLTSVSR